MVLVDTSVWIAFFRGDPSSQVLLPLLDTGDVCVNDLILAELVPSLRQRREDDLVGLLQSIHRLDLRIDWEQLSAWQWGNLQAGLNKVGIPDLIIAQNAVQQSVPLLSLDKHFSLMSARLGLELVAEN